MKINKINLKSNFIYLLLGILLHSSCSSTKELETAFNEAEVFEQGYHGFALYDPEKQEMVYEHNSEKYFTPASNTKLFTFYTGLKLLGDSIPGLKYAVSNDSLIFWGTGDPSFLNPDLPDSKILEFLKSRQEKLFYMPPKYEIPHFGSGWAWNDYNAYYSVEKSAFPIYANRVEFEFTPGNPNPKIHPSYFENSIEKDSLLDHFQMVKRDIDSNIFSIKNFERDEPYTQQVPFKHSPELLAELLSDTLKKAVKVIREKPKQASVDIKLYSVFSDSIYKRMLEVSDNFIAEQILLLAAGEISDTLKSEIAIKEMKERYLKDLPDDPKWVDGSGLSRYNLFTPRTMIRLLEKIKNEVPQERLFNLLATGGKSGTLKNSYKAVEPYIFAKTGTLRNNHSLSGYLKAKSGKIFIFSFMNSNYTVTSSNLRFEMQRIMRMVYENY